MFLDRDYTTTLWIAFSIFLIIVASVIVPIYGRRRKGWKGLALGCLAQPFVCAIVILIALLGIYAYELWDFKKETDKAMLIVRSIEKKGDRVDTLFWYVKPDEECILKRKRQELSEEEEERDSTEKSRNIERFDVVPIANFAHGVNIEDRIMVRFDLKNHSVVATDYDDRAEVTKVDWDQVSDFFSKK